MKGIDASSPEGDAAVVGASEAELAADGDGLGVAAGPWDVV
jgi:hypothetical protein